MQRQRALPAGAAVQRACGGRVCDDHRHEHDGHTLRRQLQGAELLEGEAAEEEGDALAAGCIVGDTKHLCGCGVVFDIVTAPFLAADWRALMQVAGSVVCHRGTKCMLVASRL